ncbi:hypothetical protein GCM10009087_42910 [Sphingomonas oligophenolica]|uniref:Uncharacterized protein n=1 Tax=Sphingomonas oligophenolica TaxID=301154 RepID=A0ABU9XZH5_9SPHN
MARAGAAALEAAGHEVIVSDLYAMDFDPVSDRRNSRLSPTGAAWASKPKRRLPAGTMKALASAPKAVRRKSPPMETIASVAR